jgi:hypothetical protein
VIYTAELVGDPDTNIAMISESELQTGVQAASNSVITSQTNYNIQFSVGGLTAPVSLLLGFYADPALWAQIDNTPPLTSAQARASVAANFTLDRTSGLSASVSWAPNGVVSATGCNTENGGGMACAELADPENLNVGVSTASIPGNSTYSRLPDLAPIDGLDQYGFPADKGFNFFGIRVTNITAGEYSLRLSATTTADVVRVPEPGSLVLLGTGLFALGASVVRRKKHQLG